MDLGRGDVTVYNLNVLEELGLVNLDKLPFSIRVLLENVLRSYDSKIITVSDVNTIASWPNQLGETIPFMPGRVVLQKFFEVFDTLWH